MKTIKAGRKPQDFWPFNKQITCHNCGGVYQLEEGVDKDKIKRRMSRDQRGDDEEVITAEFKCPNCHRDIVIYPQIGDILREQFYGR